MSKLTVRQNVVMWCLQNGFELITDSTMRGAIVGNSQYQFNIGTTLFWNLSDKGFIEQQVEWPFHWVITKIGRDVKTKPVEIAITS